MASLADDIVRMPFVLAVDFSHPLIVILRGFMNSDLTQQGLHILPPHSSVLRL